MKKIVSAMIAIAIVFSLTICGFAASDIPTKVAISANDSYTAVTETASEKVVSGLYTLITASKKTSLKASEVTELARLKFSGFKNKNGSADYIVYKKVDGSLYTIKNKRLYKLDADKFYMLVDESGIGFYKYRLIPTAKLGMSDIPMTASSYRFKKLDGLFYTTKFKQDDLELGEEDGGVIQTPRFSLEPKSVNVTATYESDNIIMWNGELSKVRDFKPEKSGTYIIRYTAKYEGPYYGGEVVYEYRPNYSVRPKEVKFFVEGAVTAPGEVVFLKAWNIPEGGKVTVKSDISFTPRFFRQANGDMVALFPVSYYTAPGNHYVELSCGEVAQRFALDTKTKKFVEQYLTVPAATADATINSQKANDEFEKAIAPIRYISDEKQYWSGRFIWPLKELPARTTAFGAIRYTNGDTKNPSRHGAIDFAAAAGTPVYAPAAGRVLYSGNLQLTGNTICIEHGYGLKTWYYHMNGRSVNTNDMVKQGQQIGVVGSTGFSTGAHLHYGMSVSNTTSGNVWINPETAVTTDMFYAFPSEWTVG